MNFSGTGTYTLYVSSLQKHFPGQDGPWINHWSVLLQSVTSTSGLSVQYLYINETIWNHKEAGVFYQHEIDWRQCDSRDQWRHQAVLAPRSCVDCSRNPNGKDAQNERPLACNCPPQTWRKDGLNTYTASPDRCFLHNNRLNTEEGRGHIPVVTLGSEEDPQTPQVRYFVLVFHLTTRHSWRVVLYVAARPMADTNCLESHLQHVDFLYDEDVVDQSQFFQTCWYGIGGTGLC